MTAAVPPFEEWKCARAQVGDVSIFYRTAGSGPTVVLLHGFPLHSLVWHAIAPQLAEHFTVVVPDQRGVGNTTILADGYDATTLATDLLGLLNALDVENVSIVGYDHGTSVAVAFARDHPERVERVVCIELALPGFGYVEHMQPQPDHTLYSSNWHLGLFTQPDLAEFLCRGRERDLLTWWLYHEAFSANAKISPKHFEAYLREITKPGALRAGIMYYAAIWKNVEDNQVLHERPLQSPLLVLGGEVSLAPLLKDWKPVGTDVTLAVIPEAGHWIGDENPTFTASAIVDFFSGPASETTPVSG